MTFRTNSPKILLVNYMGIKICSAFGHRDVFEDISRRLSSAVRMAVKQGCEIFYTGAMGEFDEVFSSEVRALKKDYPNIKLICVKPYMTTEINNQGEYLYTLYDDIVIPTELADVHYKAAIKKRNEWMITKSDLVILYVKRDFGGAYKAKQFAVKNERQVILI